METTNYFELLIKAAHNAPCHSIDDAIDLLSETIENGKNIYVCGNGGSAKTASHFVTDWSKMRWVNKKEKLKAFCLSDNIGMLTAYANDLSYEEIFAEPLKNYAETGDLLVVLSGSGNSQNVVNAINAAKDLGLKTIGLSGFLGGEVKKLVDISVHFEVNDMQIVEDLHLSFGHIAMKRLCE
jgi:D-sedoheptulose 7-phosphate isomerase